MSTFEQLTIIIASYGAGLSTINALVRYISNRNQLKVKLSNGCLTYSYGQSSGIKLFIEAINNGKRSIPLSACGLLIEGSKESIVVMEGETPLPHVLKPFDSIKYWIDIPLLKDSLREMTNNNSVKVRGIFRTKTGLETKSKTWSIDF